MVSFRPAQRLVLFSVQLVVPSDIKMSRYYPSTDVPREGYRVKMIQALLSPPESEIESHIASVDPLYVEQIRKGVNIMRSYSSARLLSLPTTSSGTIHDHAKHTSEWKLGKRISVDEKHERRAQRLHSGEQTEAQLIQARLNQVDRHMTVRDRFGLYVTPSPILELIHSYNPNVLCDQDLLDIEAITEVYGEKAGAYELYDRLQHYPDWLKTVTDVLRDPEVDMDWLADLLLSQSALNKAADFVFNNPENRNKIAGILKSKLRLSLEPLKILQLFHVYDPDVLTQSDLDTVAQVTIDTNNQTGTDALIDRLLLYPGWKPCLTSVLNHIGLDGLVEQVSEAFLAEFSELRKAQKFAQKKLQSQMKKYKRLEVAEKLTVPSSATGSKASSGRRRQAHKNQLDLKKLLDTSNCPLYTGVDWKKKLGAHSMDTLPSAGELCEQNLKLLKDREASGVRQKTGIREPELDPWKRGQQYLEKYAITELLTFMLSGVIMNKPNKPLDFLIDMSREIKRLDATRQSVDQQKAEKNKQKSEVVECEKSEASVQGDNTSEIVDYPEASCV